MSANQESFEVLMEIMEDDTNSLEVRSMIPEMIKNVDAPAFLRSARKQFQTKGSQHDLAPFLAKGVAAVTDPNAETQAADTGAMIRKQNAGAPDSFKAVMEKLRFKSNDSKGD